MKHVLSVLAVVALAGCAKNIPSAQVLGLVSGSLDCASQAEAAAPVCKDKVPACVSLPDKAEALADALK